MPNEMCTICAIGYAKDPINPISCITVDATTDFNCQAVNGCSGTSCLQGNIYALNSANQCLKCNEIYRNCVKCSNTVCHQC